MPGVKSDSRGCEGMFVGQAMETKQTKSEAMGTNLKQGTTETYLGPEPNGKTLGAGEIETDL